MHKTLAYYRAYLAPTDPYSLGILIEWKHNSIPCYPIRSITENNYHCHQIFYPPLEVLTKYIKP